VSIIGYYAIADFINPNEPDTLKLNNFVYFTLGYIWFCVPGHRSITFSGYRSATNE